MPWPEDPVDFNQRIEALTQALETSPDVQARSSAKELARLILEFHAVGLARILGIVGAHELLKQQLISDPAVAALLDLHDLSSPTLAARPSQTATLSAGPLLQIIRQTPPVSAALAPAHRERAVACERCREPLPPAHNHFVDLTTRRLSCSCRACWLLSGATDSPSLRAVPERYLQGPGLHLHPVQWDTLQIPVSIAFFMFNASIGRTIAFYPSPAGATESALPMIAWQDIERANPWVRTLAPDVEALLVRKRQNADGQCDGFIVPIDACYDLVGRIRVHWQGFGGGAEVQAEIDRFFIEVDVRCTGIAAAVGGRS